MTAIRHRLLLILCVASVSGWALGQAGCMRQSATKTKDQATPAAATCPGTLAPPTSAPDCKASCAYFVHCQSARWSAEEEQKEMRERCLQDCEGAAKADPKSQEAVFFGGIAKCAVGKPCVEFGQCMREIITQMRSAMGGDEPEEDPNAVYQVPVGGSPSRGPADAPVTVVMLADYQCGFCAKGWNTILELEKAYPGKIRLVYKHFPLPNHSEGKMGADVANCVLEQKGLATFWKLHERIFQNPTELSEMALLAHAQAVGADTAKVKACMGEGKHAALLVADLKLGASLGVDGTPAFFINGKKITGAHPLETFKTAYADGLNRAEEAMGKGVKPAEVYEHLIKDGATNPVFLKGTGPAGAAQPEEQPELDPTVVFRVPVSRSDAVRGPADALVTIVGFSDFQCPACAVAAKQMARLLGELPKDLRLVYRHFPLPSNPLAPLAAEAALAVRAQKGDAGFFAFHDKLYANQEELSRPVLEKLAEALGVDMARFKKALDDRTHRDQVEADRKLGERLAVPGTPVYFINGRVMLGVPQTYEELARRIREEIAAAQKQLTGGVTRASLYEHLMKDAKSEPVFLQAKK